MLKDIAKALSKSGFTVEVVSTLPSYKKNFKVSLNEEDDEIPVTRLNVGHESRSNKFLRLFSMMKFIVKTSWQIVKRKPDVVMFSTVPQVLGGFFFGGLCKLLGVKFIYHCQDIHPEIARLGADVRGGLLYKILLRMDSWTVNNSKCTVVLSKDMREHLLERAASDDIRIINNFSLSSEFSEVSSVDKYPLPEDTFKIIFAGNIGRFQGLDKLLELDKYLHSSNRVEFVFMGEGVLLDELKASGESLVNSTYTFIPHQPIDKAMGIIKQCQVALVTLTPNIYKYAYPSKTITNLSLGMPLLALVEEESELAVSINDMNLGFAANINSEEGVLKVANWINYNSSINNLAKISDNCNAYFRENFEKSLILKKWTELYRDVVNEE